MQLYRIALKPVRIAAVCVEAGLCCSRFVEKSRIYEKDMMRKVRYNEGKGKEGKNVIFRIMS